MLVPCLDLSGMKRNCLVFIGFALLCIEKVGSLFYVFYQARCIMEGLKVGMYNTSSPAL